jgi:hypothetical protein
MGDNDLEKVQAGVLAEIKKKLPQVGERIEHERANGNSLLGTTVDELVRLKLLAAMEKGAGKSILEQKKSEGPVTLQENVLRQALNFPRGLGSEMQFVRDAANSQGPIANLIMDIVDVKVSAHLGKGGLVH